MHIAVTVWNDRISPVFDTARRALVADVNEDGTIGLRSELALQPKFGQCVPQLVQAQVEVLLCGAISRPLADAVRAAGIRLIPYLSGEVEKVLDAFVAGTISDPAFQMPGCCGRRKQCRRGGLMKGHCRDKNNVEQNVKQR